MWKEIKQDSYDYWNSLRNDVLCKKGFYNLLASFGLFAPFIWLGCVIFAVPLYPIWMFIMISLTLQEYAEKKGQEMSVDHAKE